MLSSDSVKKLGPGSGTTSFCPARSSPASSHPADSSASVTPENRQMPASANMPCTSSSVSARAKLQSDQKNPTISKPIRDHPHLGCLRGALKALGFRSFRTLLPMADLEHLDSPHILEAGDGSFADIVLRNSAIGPILVNFW